MIVLIVILVSLILSFSLVVLIGAPYLPTLKPQIKSALELSQLKPGQTLIELGCGDGRVAVAAAKRGYTVIGYEINPWLALLAWARTRRYGAQVKIVWGNFWQKDWPEAEAAFCFLASRFMGRLDKKCMRYKHKPLTLVSFAFAIPDKRPIKQKNGLLVYKYS